MAMVWVFASFVNVASPNVAPSASFSPVRLTETPASARSWRTFMSPS